MIKLRILRKITTRYCAYLGKFSTKTSVYPNAESLKPKKLLNAKLKNDKSALSPAVSTVVLVGTTVMLMLVALNFASTFLNARIVENEFSSAKQFMQTIGLQIDDVSWIVGRTQTTRYASQYGEVDFEPSVLNYTVYVDKGEGYSELANYSVGIVLFNMRIDRYSIGNNYFERISPSSIGSFLQNGASAPVSMVYAIEKLPMNDGDFIRVVTVPSLRMLNSTISAGGEETKYFKFYLPILEQGSNPRNSKSITLIGNAVSFATESANAIKIRTTFPKASSGFDMNFFNFDSVEEIVDVPDGAIVEFYTGEVTVSLGLPY